MLLAAFVLVGPNLSFAADGKQALLDNRCNLRDADWLDRYLKKEIEIGGKTHRTIRNKGSAGDFAGRARRQVRVGASPAGEPS